MDEAELKRRTKAFAIRCMKLAEDLPQSRSGNAVANHLIRCGTSVGANYRAACRGRSRAEFLSKLGVVEEEADDSAFWMEIAMEARMEPARRVQPLRDEADELVRIMVASIRTARTAPPPSPSPRRTSSNPKSAVQNPK
jgi:four helix bundle protein